MSLQTPPPGPITDVEVGMPVFDSDNERIGTVEVVKLGDPQAVTAQGQQPQAGLADMIKETFSGTEPDVHPELAARLLRIGYVKIDGKGLFATDLYASAEQIQSADADGVRLNIPGEGLMPQA